MAFCTTCGKQLAPEFKFCPVCGTASAVAGLQPRETVDTWSELQSSWWISGCFNVESGNGSVNTRYFLSCECHLEPLEGQCADCGRTSTTSLAFPTGHGDGVYPTFALEDARKRTMGAIAFFTEEWALGVENNTHAPADILRQATPIRVGTLESTGKVLFSEAWTGLNDQNVTVDISVRAVPHEVIAWIGEIPTLKEADSYPIQRPMALGVYGPELAEALNEVAYVDRDPNSWEAFQPWNTMTWQVMAHIEPEWARALMYNFHDDSKRGAGDRAMSWMLQGALHGDEQCQQQASEILRSRDPQAVEYRDHLLSLRGQVTNM